MSGRRKPAPVLNAGLSSVLLISRYILRLGQAAQKQHCPRCPNCMMYLEIRGADEGPFSFKKENPIWVWILRLPVRKCLKTRYNL